MKKYAFLNDSGKNLLCGLGTALLFLYLVLWPKQGSAAAARGLLQWYQAVLPSLLPLMMISRLLICTHILTTLMRPLAIPARALLGCSLYGTYAMLAGFLCGYPMGVKILSDLYGEHLISGEECRRLAPVLNNVSPAFVINYVIIGLFGQSLPMLPALGALYGGPLLYGFFSYHMGRQKVSTQYSVSNNRTSANIVSSKGRNRKQSVSQESERKLKVSQNKEKTSSGYRLDILLDACVMESIRQIVRLGGYMVFFCVLASPMQLLTSLSPLIPAAISGLLEITGGVSLTAAAEAPLMWRYLLSLALLSFGGLCSAMQSSQLLQNIGCSLRRYLQTKLIITLLTLLLAVIFWRLSQL